jgi:uncharacterized protein YdhG (YjbR/CyaY superfamily)
VTARDIDEYLDQVDEPQRCALRSLRDQLRELLPDAQECISYGMPAFWLDGKVIAGFAAFKNHLSYLPHSGSVLPALADDLAGFASTKGSLHFTVDQPLPTEVVAKLVATRLGQLER